VESLQFLFDGGVLDKDTIATIRLNDSELSELVWIAIDESERLFRGGRVARRLRASASFLGTGRVVYLEDQQPVSGSIDLTE
jgi:hypothetical protein